MKSLGGRLGFISVVGVLIAAVVAIVVSSEPTRSPKQELAAVRAFVEDAKAVRFTASTTSVQGDPEAEIGSTYTYRSEESGEFELPDRSHVVSNDGEYLYEAVVVPTGYYGRDAESEADLRRALWRFEKPPTAEELAESGAIEDVTDYSGDPVALAAAGMEFSGFASPQSLFGLLEELESPTRVATGVIRATASLEDVMGNLFSGVDIEELGFEPEDFEGEVNVTLTSEPDGRLTRMVTEMTTDFMGEDSVDTADIRFFDWNGAIRVVEPDPEKIDPTPDVNEEKIAEFDAAPVLVPSALPAGWKLLSGDVSAESEEDMTCEQVNLEFGDPVAHEAAYNTMAEDMDSDEFVFPPAITIYAMSAGCDLEEVEGEEPFTIGRYEATADERDDDYGGRYVYMVVGDTRLHIESTLSDDEIRRLFSNLVPLDLKTMPIASG